MVNFDEVRRTQIHSPHLHVGAPGIFSDLLRSVQMLKREWGEESNGKLPHLFIPSKTANFVPEVAVEDLPLNKSLWRWSGQKPWWNWYLTPEVNFGDVRRAQLAKYTLLTSALGPLGSSQRESEARKATGSYHTYLFLVKLQPFSWSCSGRPGFGQNCSLGSCVCSETPALGQNTLTMIWSKTLMELLFDPCGEFRWSPEGPSSQIHSPHLHIGAPGIFLVLLRSVQMLNREWGAKSNGKLFIPSKTAIFIPEFAVEDLPLYRTATLIPAIAVKNLPSGKTLWWWWWWWWLMMIV